MNPKTLSLFSFLINLLLVIGKLTTGIISHSVALIAEAIHSLLDVVSSLIAFLGIRASDRPADKEHPYGHEKYEGVASFIVVVLLFLTGVWILY